MEILIIFIIKYKIFLMKKKKSLMLCRIILYVVKDIDLIEKLIL